MRWKLCSLLLVALLIGADAKDDDAQKEIKRFAGDWVMAAGEREGQKLPDDQVKAGKITWKGLEAHVVTPHQSKDPIKAVCTIDPTKSTKEMEWVRSTGPDAGKKFLAIYEFIGDDQYRVCFAPPGKDRPKEFTTKPNSGQMMHTWKRSKP